MDIKKCDMCKQNESTSIIIFDTFPDENRIYDNNKFRRFDLCDICQSLLKNLVLKEIYGDE